MTLDALRGLAALFVVARHYGSFTGGYVPRFSYLAVDLFFVLSGFVLAYANDHRFASGMTVREFMFARVRRLYPLYLLGLAIGLAANSVGPERQKAWLTAAMSMPNFIGLPTIPGFNGQSVMAINGALWSLFFEFWVANLVFAMFWKALHGRSLLILTALCGAALILSERVNYTLDVGFTWNTFGWGFARVGYSFFAGVLFARFYMSGRHTITVPSTLCLALLSLLIVVPVEGRAAHLAELCTTLVAFPLLIYVGAGAKERRPWLGQALGDASYAVYVIHYPVLVLFAYFLHSQPFIRSTLAEALAVGLLGCIAWAAQTWIDAPLRRAISLRLSGANQ